MVKTQRKRDRRGCKEVLDEDLANALSDYEPSEIIVNEHYQCRDCGTLFDTLEEHDVHRRKIHSQEEPYCPTGLLVQ